MTDPLEMLIAEELQRRAREVSAGAAPVDGVDRRARRLASRRRAAEVAGAVACVALIGGGALFFRPTADGSPSGAPVGVARSAPSRLSLKTSASSASAARTSSAVSAPRPLSQADAVRQYLETPAHWAASGLFAAFHGRIFCGVNILGASTDKSKLFVWALCEEYYNDKGSARLGSSTGEALLVAVTGTGAGTQVLAIRVPRGGATYGKEIRSLFSAAAAQVVLSGQTVTVDESEGVLAQRARAELAKGRL